MTPFYSIRFKNTAAVIISDVYICAERLENIAKSYESGQIKSVATRRAVLAVVADFKKATRNYSRLFRAAYNLTGSTVGEPFDVIGEKYSAALYTFYKSYDYFGI